MRNFWFFIVLTVLLTGCGSSRHTSSKTASAKEEKQQLIYRESDEIFDKFKRKNEDRLNTYTLEYIDKYKYIALEKMMEYKIPASITLAQGILESGNGRSELTRKANNHFGIKCHKDWKGKKVRYDDDRRRECFRKYDDPEGSFNDHSMFLTTRSRYEGLFKLKPDDYKGWAKGLKKAGYATDRRYPKKLIGLIEDYHLYVFDNLVLDKKGFAASKKEVKKSKKSNKKRLYIVVTSGDTLYSIARNNNTTVERLKQINKLKNNDINVGQKIFLK